MLSQASVWMLREAFHALVQPRARPESDGPALRANRGWDAVPLPRTWFIALRSRELPRQGIAATRLLGRELAFFRTADGTVAALDAYCPHLGADLRGGQVRGDRLQCPFHGLEWLADGTCPNLSTLFSADHVTTARSYPVIERNGAIHAWLGTGDQPPAGSRRSSSPTWPNSAVRRPGSTATWSWSRWPASTRSMRGSRIGPSSTGCDSVPSRSGTGSSATIRCCTSSASRSS